MREISGIGCDMVSVPRIQNMLSKPRFLEKVYTNEEQTYLQKCSAHTAAGLWAAKEAVCKALGTGFVGFTPKDIEIRHTQSGQPYVLLHNRAARIAAARNLNHIHLSISHEREQALAFVIAEMS